jgi:hypothetical protein
MLLAENNKKDCGFLGMTSGQIKITDLFEFPRMIDAKYQRPNEQWWLKLQEIAALFENYKA